MKQISVWGSIGAAAVLLLLASVSITFAALNFSGMSITGDSSSVVDATGTISIGASSATGITIGRAGVTTTFPGNLSVNNATVTSNLAVLGSLFDANGNKYSTSTSNGAVVGGIIYASQYAGADIGAKINAALADAANCPSDGTYKHCVIMLPQSTSSVWSTPVVVTSPYVSIIGQGKSQSTFSCTVNGDCLRVYTLPFDGPQTGGTFQGFSLIGTGTSLGVGLHIGDITGVNLIDLGMYNFYGANGAGIWFDNANVGNSSGGTYTERTLVEGVELNNNAEQVRFTNEIQPGNTFAGQPSFGYTRILDLKLGMSPGQIGIITEEAVQIYNSTIRVTVNSATSTAIFRLGNTSQFQGELHLAGEGTATNLFNGDSGSLVTLTQDSSVQWLGSTPPPSILSAGSGLILGPVSGIATGGTLASLIPALSLNVLNPIVVQGNISNANGIVIPSSTTGSTGSGKVILAPSASTTINGTSCALGGSCTGPGNVVGTVSLSAQTTDPSGSIYSVPASSGTYLACVELPITRAASTSSTAPYVNIVYTSALDSNLKYATPVYNNTANSTAAVASGCIPVDAKASTTITYQTGGYTSSGSTSMQFGLNITVMSENASGN